MARNQQTNEKLRNEMIERIELAAIEVFALQGYGSAKISDIAKHAEISQGIVYTYFSSKQELFIHCVEKVHYMPQKMASTLDNYPISDYQKMYLFMSGFHKMLVDNNDEAKIGKYSFIISIDAFTKSYGFDARPQIKGEIFPLYPFLEKWLNGIYTTQQTNVRAEANARVLLYLFVGLAQATSPNEESYIPTVEEILTLLQIQIESEEI